MASSKMSRYKAEQVLGLSGEYDYKTFQAQFRAMVKTNHPDLGGDPKKMVEINAAKKVIDALFATDKTQKVHAMDSDNDAAHMSGAEQVAWADAAAEEFVRNWSTQQRKKAASQPKSGQASSSTKDYNGEPINEQLAKKAWEKAYLRIHDTKQDKDYEFIKTRQGRWIRIWPDLVSSTEKGRMCEREWICRVGVPYELIRQYTSADLWVTHEQWLKMNRAAESYAIDLEDHREYDKQTPEFYKQMLDLGYDPEYPPSESKLERDKLKSQRKAEEKEPRLARTSFVQEVIMLIAFLVVANTVKIPSTTGTGGLNDPVMLAFMAKMLILFAAIWIGSKPIAKAITKRYRDKHGLGEEMSEKERKERDKQYRAAKRETVVDGVAWVLESFLDTTNDRPDVIDTEGVYGGKQQRKSASSASSASSRSAGGSGRTGGRARGPQRG